MITPPRDYTILVVENNQFNIELLLSILIQHDYRLAAATTGKKALRICEEITPDLILMDVQMPDMDGFETAKKLLKNEKTRHIPILFTSTFSDSKNILRCFESGGVDYISKPFKKNELLARINTHLSLKNLREQLETDRDHLTAILQNMLPAEVIRSLKNGSFPNPRFVEKAAVLFTDFKNFSDLTHKVGSNESVRHLNQLYFVFDKIVAEFGLERIKTIGDAYFSVGGINTTPDNLYLSPVLAGLKMQEFVRYYNTLQTNIRWELRIGVTIGPVTSGVIGYQKIAYDVWGDTVNFAQRLESRADPGQVAVPEHVYQKIHDQVEVSRLDVLDSSTWGRFKLYQCKGISDQIPASQISKLQRMDPESMLHEVSDKKSILGRIFHLPGRTEPD